jgi:hypothetical protein
MGTVAIEGTTLFALDRSSERVTIVILATDMEKAIEATGRLLDRALTDCLQAGTVTVCSTGETAEESDETEGPAEEEPEETPADGEELPAAGSIFIIGSDDKPEGARTGVPEFEAILSDSYDVTTWYTSRDGLPTIEDVAGYDAYIIDTGDYEADVADLDVFTSFEEIESGGIMFIGAQPLPFFIDFEPIDDLQVTDSTHPLAAGFEPDEILALSASESGVPAVLAEEGAGDGTDDATVVFRRGPDSPSPGAIVVMASQDDLLEVRTIIALFSFYRLPEDAQRTFALNAAAWLVGAEE